MTVEAVTYIDDLDPTYPTGTDGKNEGDNHLRNIKSGIKASLPNITGAMTATQAELNNLDGYTGNTSDLNILSGASAAGLTAAELQYLNSVTSDVQTQLDAKLTATSNLSDIDNAATARTNLGLGSLAVENTLSPNNLDSHTAGSYIALSAGGDTGTHTSFTKVKEVYCPTSGTITITFTMQATNGGSPVQARVYKNGAAVGTNRSTLATTYQTYTENFTISAGDSIQLYSTGIGTNYCIIGDFQVKVGNPLSFNQTL